MYLVEGEEVRDMWATFGDAEGGGDVNVEGQFGSLVDEPWVAFQLYLGCKHGQG